MTTPAQNITQLQNFSVYQVRRDANGNIVSQGTTTDVVQVRRLIRPASSTNPVRLDNTRKPGPWSSTWRQSGGFHGTLSMNYSPGNPLTHSGLVRGNIALDFDPTQDLSTVNPLLTNARLKALAKVTNDTMQFNAALAQAKGTLKLAADFSSEAAHQLDNLMAGPKGLAKKLGKMSQWRKLPDRYLAYLYGIAPLADDLENATTQLVKYGEKGFDMSVILKSSLRQTDSISHTPVSMHNGSSGFVFGRANGIRKMAARVGYRFDLPGWFLDQAPIVAPFSTAYELTKLSFVVDWFLPIGNWIGAMESAQWSPFFREGWETMYIQDVYDNLVYTGSNPTVHVSSKGRILKGKMSRSYLNVYPLLKGLALNPLPEWPKAAQGLALLTQAFKRWY